MLRGVIDPFSLAPTSGARFFGGLVLLEILVFLVPLDFLELLVFLVPLDFLEKKSLWPKPEALIFRSEPRVRGEHKRVCDPEQKRVCDPLTSNV